MVKKQSRTVRSNRSKRNRLVTATVAIGTGGFHPRLQRLFKFGRFLGQETERGAVLVATGLLDEVVKDILRQFLYRE